MGKRTSSSGDGTKSVNLVEVLVKTNEEKKTKNGVGEKLRAPKAWTA